MAVNFVMRRAMDRHKFGIPWRELERLIDLDSADDIALIGATKKHNPRNDGEFGTGGGQGQT